MCAAQLPAVPAESSRRKFEFEPLVLARGPDRVVMFQIHSLKHQQLYNYFLLDQDKLMHS